MARTGEAENKQANADTAALQADSARRVNAATDKYNTGLSAMEAEGDPFSKPDYLQNENMLASEGAGAANASALEGVDNAVGRTGTNTTAEPYYRSLMAKDRMRSQGATLVGQKSADTQNSTAYRQWLLGAKLAPAGVDTSMFATATGGRNAALGNLTQFGLASYGPVNSAIGAAGAAGAAYAGKKS